MCILWNELYIKWSLAYSQVDINLQKIYIFFRANNVHKTLFTIAIKKFLNVLASQRKKSMRRVGEMVFFFFCC